jgi:hypothetical protein
MKKHHPRLLLAATIAALATTVLANRTTGTTSVKNTLRVTP